MYFLFHFEPFGPPFGSIFGFFWLPLSSIWPPWRGPGVIGAAWREEARKWIRPGLELWGAKMVEKWGRLWKALGRLTVAWRASGGLPVLSGALGAP